MNQASDMFFFLKFGFFWKKVAIFRKNFKNDNFLNGIKTKLDKIKNSNIVEKIWFASKFNSFVVSKGGHKICN